MPLLQRPASGVVAGAPPAAAEVEELASKPHASQSCISGMSKRERESTRRRGGAPLFCFLVGCVWGSKGEERREERREEKEEVKRKISQPTTFIFFFFVRSLSLLFAPFFN